MFEIESIRQLRTGEYSSPATDVFILDAKRLIHVPCTTMLTENSCPHFRISIKTPDPQEQSVSEEPVSEAKPFQIVEGGFYLNRKGEKIGPMVWDKVGEDDGYPWVLRKGSTKKTWTVNGRYGLDASQDNPRDLIAPWPDQPAQAPAVDLWSHEREELRKANAELAKDRDDWKNLARGECDAATKMQAERDQHAAKCGELELLVRGIEKLLSDHRKGSLT